MGLESLDLQVLARTPGVTFVLWGKPKRPLPENALVCPDDTVPYHDLLAACDVVIMKPGYGTVADCLANRVPMVYATRPGFEEERVLIAAMHELGHAAFVSTDDLLQGRLGQPIREVLYQRKPWWVAPTDGVRQIAQRILQIAEA
jgi:UDP:flavonoid glycosyltransferase YjiC (YdhE family)